MSNSRILILLFYVLTGLWAAGQLVFIEHVGIEYVATIAIALAPTVWFLRDFAKRGSYVPHILQPALLVAWPVVVPVYVIATRRLRGFWQVLIHAVASWALYVACFYATIYFVWGADAFR
jgi:hypothetical protein